MKPWELEPTYRLVKATFGVAQERLARESTRSVLDRQAFASYHFTEAIRLTRTFERKYLTESLLIDLYGQNAGKTRNAFEKYILKSGAHATGAVQSLHSIPDILAHAVYFSSGQNTKGIPLKERAIDLPTVVQKLRGDSDFSSIAAPLESIQSGKGWLHLSALSNLSKHRTVVRAALSEDLTGTRENFRELQFRSCEYRKEPYPPISLRKLLEPEHHRLSTAILEVGHELHACLLRTAA